MINLTKLNEFKIRVSKHVVNDPLSIVQQQQISKIKYYTVASYEEYADVLGDGVSQLEDLLIQTLKRSIDVALGKTVDDTTETKTKGQAPRKLPVSKRGE